MTITRAEAVRGSGKWGQIKQRVTPFTLFFRGFVNDPAMVGSIIPSSSVLIEAMLAPVDWSEVKLFVEYGPGVGTFTKPILEKMRPDATLIAIDTNEDFARYLTQEIADSRLLTVHGSAADVREIIAAQGFDHADFILSGLPFSTLPAGVGDRIMAETQAALRPGGAFLVYQYSARVRKTMRRHFDRIETDLVFRNIPPCRMFWGWKDEAVAKPAASPAGNSAAA